MNYSPLDQQLLNAVQFVDEESEQQIGGQSQYASELPEELQRSGKRTGPKGVLADYHEHQREEHRQRFSEQSSIVQQAYKYSMALTLPLQDVYQGQQQESLNDDDQQFIEEYRQKRLRDLKQQQSQPRQRVKYGDLRIIGASSYVKEVEDCNYGVKVLALLRVRNQLCQEISQMLQLIAKKYCFAKFLSIDALDADPDYDLIAIPSILVYQDGDLVVNMTRLIDYIPSYKSGEGFDAQDLESCLLRANAIESTDTEDFECTLNEL
ncbi:hypothetical protein MP228_010764 [Amoeboaphelidium protococcarum]|nr:hypothetical protein MP228_010764 [Amoeboaphelidium protococcarum]